MLKIGIDCRKINDGGIGVYLQNLLKSWQELDVPARFILFCNKKDFRNLEFGSEFCEIVVHDFPKYSISELFSFSGPLSRKKADLFFTPHFTLPFNLPCPAVVTIHDLIHLFYGTGHGAIGKFYARRMLYHACKTASAILTDSKNSSKDISHFFPKWSSKINIIHPAVDRNIYKEISQKEVSEFKAEKSLPDKFLLYVGALKPHKNPQALVKLANETDLPLVLATLDRNIFNSELLPQICDKRRICLVEITGSSQMALLYNAAELLVFPSFYEGFGLPPLEAMACGLPVVCSGSSSLPEVVGEAAILFHPEDYSDMLEKVNLCWRDQAIRDILKERGECRIGFFDWQQSASKIFEIFLRILGK